MLICCGEALIDMIPSPTVSGRSGFVPHVGGSVYNTAVALGRLGENVGLVSCLSSDLFGQQLMSELKSSRVDCSNIVFSDRPTKLAFVQMHNGQATYCFFDENSAGRMLQPADLPVLSDKVAALCFGGISLACEPGADAYADFCARESRGRVVMLDPNIRPSFVQDETAYRARLDGMVGLADIVKVSEEDLDWMITEPGDSRSKVEALLRAGPGMVVLTRGSLGAAAYLADGREIAMPAMNVDVVDTVGAGDTFNAGLLAALSARGSLTKSALELPVSEDIAAALSYGTRVAAITVSRAGANPPWSTEL
jgi:fructokinase